MSEHVWDVDGDLAAVIHRRLTNPPGPWCMRWIDAQGTRSVGWSELGASASGFATACADGGAVPGDVIAIAWGHGVESIAAWIGAVLGGFVPTFVPPGDTGLARLTTGPGDARWANAPLRSAVRSPSVAIVQRTSGTTDTARVVAVTHDRVLAQIRGLGQALALGPTDIIASALPLHHDMGLVSTVLLPLVCGVPCVHVDPALWRADAGALLRAIPEVRATLTWVSPAALARMVRRVAPERLDLASLRQIVTGGEVVHAHTLDAFTTRFAAAGLAPGVLGTGWGMAENVAAVTHSPPGRTPVRLRIAWSSFVPEQPVVEVDLQHQDALVWVSTGRAIAGTQVAVRSLDGTSLDDGVVGELWLRGSCQADDAWHRTGDVGLMVEGEVFVCGRAAELLRIEDRWLPPHEVELAAVSVAGVRPGRVAAVRGGDGGLVVLVEDDTERIAIDAVAHAVEARTQRWPRVIRVAPDSLPKTSSGKLGRLRCAALLGGG